MANAHLKATLAAIDLLHPSLELRAVTFTAAKDEIHPGVDHFMAQGALRCFLRQRCQQRSRQDDLAASRPLDARTSPIKTSRAAHAAVAPAQSHARLTCPDQSTVEMLPVQAVEQRQQGKQRQRLNQLKTPNILPWSVRLGTV